MNALVQCFESNLTTIEDVRKMYVGSDQWLKAPNGEPTRLYEKQWLEVRTTAFKAWFGDWEHTPEQASKVLDCNGEPMVVYHGTPSSHYDFSVFCMYDEGIFFAEHKYVADRYADRSSDRGIVREVFLNIRNPKLINTVKYEFNGFSGADARLKKMADNLKNHHPEFANTPYRYKEMVRERFQAKSYDGIVMADHSWESFIEKSRQFVVFSPCQIKSSILNNGLFSNSDDIYK